MFTPDYTSRILVSFKAANGDGSKILYMALKQRKLTPSKILDPTPIKSSEDGRLEFKASKGRAQEIKEQLDGLGMSYTIVPIKD